MGSVAEDDADSIADEAHDSLPLQKGEGQVLRGLEGLGGKLDQFCHRLTLIEQGLS